MIKTTEYYKYAIDVVTGKIIAGNLIKLSCLRFLDDLNRPDLCFKSEVVTRCFNFISTLKHYTGKHANNPFILEPWQQFIVANIVGWYWSENNLRRFTSSYIEVARKQGKTALAAALCLYYLIFDNEDGAEVLLAANSKEQAKIAFEMCSNFVKGLDSKQKYFIPYRADISFPAKKSKLKVLAADDSTLDGFNASFGLLDEYHAAPNSRVRDVIKSSMGMRANPHLCTITTAGFDKTLPCYKLREVGCDVLSKLKTDDSFFIAIYSLDNEDDWTDESVWIKSSPNLNVTVSPKYIREQVQQAINNPSDEVGVKTKNLNVWCDSIDVWIPDRYIAESMQRVNLNDYRDCDCYIGVDLASVSDLTAVTFMIPTETKLIYKTHYYLPESALEKSTNKVLYQYWKQQGYLTVTAGNVTDYDYITNDIMSMYDVLNIMGIYYDPYNSTQWAIKCTELGLPLQPHSQSLANFNKPTKELERLILSDSVIIDSNEINMFCFRNVSLKSDWNGNVKPIKTIDSKKIDGVISSLMALGGYLSEPRYSNQIMIL